MLTVFTLNDSDKWDGIVKSFDNYDVYYLSGYTRAFQFHGDGEPLLFYYEGNDFRAINVVMKRDIAKDKNFSGKLVEGSYFDITTPYGYGGLLIQGKPTEDGLRQLNIQYLNYCKKNGIISEFVRFHPVLKNDEVVDDLYDISRLGMTISMSLYSREQIWSNLTSKNRNMIRKAQKTGVEIFWGRDTELVKSFIPMYNATMSKDNALDYYYFGDDFYNSILNDCKYNALMFYAIYQGRKVAMSIVLFANKQLHYHLSASEKEYQHLAPTNLLLYEAACWGSENGYNTFHLGGGLGAKEDNLFKFKSSFNRNSKNAFVIGRKIFDKEKYQVLVESRQLDERIENTKFFPKYRS